MRTGRWKRSFIRSRTDRRLQENENPRSIMWVRERFGEMERVAHFRAWVRGSMTQFINSSVSQERRRSSEASLTLPCHCVSPVFAQTKPTRTKLNLSGTS